MDDGSVTFMIRQLKAGDNAAAQGLWERYFQGLIGAARKRLEGSPRRVADEEDAALSAFRSFCRRLQQGNFPKLDDRNDLWRLLVTIASRKAVKQAVRLRRRKRGGMSVRGESALLSGDASASHAGMAAIADQEPTPAFAAELTEQFQSLMDRLNDDGLRRLALMKLEGYSNEEIAQGFQCGLRTIERRLRLIRTIWCEAGPS
jgi:DNA-directed RNA polymerase specialized sigma24 family protein